MPAAADDDFARFRAEREAELVEPYGWLTLKAFHWLPTRPGPLPGLPARWSTDPDQRAAQVDAEPADGLTRDGEPLVGRHALGVDEYGRVPWVDHGEARVELLRRGGRLAVRVRAASSPEREAFAGVPMFPYDPSWRVPATFTPYAEPRAVPVDTIRADLRQVVHPLGELDLVLAGEPQRLAVTKGKYGWGVEFYDPTNGTETERWRQLHFDAPAPGSDRVELDFNRTLNMWFAFTPFATCPAPIPGNTVTVAVRAGEQRWRP